MSEDNTPKLTDFGNAALKEYSLRFSTTTSGPGMSIRWTVYITPRINSSAF